jgi:hypothetical protein
MQFREAVTLKASDERAAKHRKDEPKTVQWQVLSQIQKYKVQITFKRLTLCPPHYDSTKKAKRVLAWR